jgi:predicted AlkP superfamily pyrophosphatase or phosphodiesterase
LPAKKKALILGIDGCRPDALLAASTPSFDSLIENGSFSDQAQTGAYTISAPGWADMLTGVWYDKHGITDNSFEGRRLEEYPHFFARLKEKAPHLNAVSIVNWAPINEEILSGADRNVEIPDDAEVAKEAIRTLKQDDLDLLFIQFDEVDAGGHKHEYRKDSAGYLAVIEKTDALIGLILDALKSRASFGEEDWLIVSGTDHGGSGTSHGQDIPDHRTIYLIVSGDSAKKGEISPAPEIVDVPPTVAAHLGIEPDPAWGWEGRVIGLDN